MKIRKPKPLHSRTPTTKAQADNRQIGKSGTHPSTPLIAMAFIVTIFMSAGHVWAEKVKANRTEINAFLKADTNADQKLNKSEFRAFVNLMATAGQPTAKRIRFFRAYGFAFSIVDKDRNGILSPMELRTADNNFRSGKL